MKNWKITFKIFNNSSPNIVFALKAYSKSLLGDSYEDDIYKDNQNQLILSNVHRCLWFLAFCARC